MGFMFKWQEKYLTSSGVASHTHYSITSDLRDLGPAGTTRKHGSRIARAKPGTSYSARGTGAPWKILKL